MKYIKMKLYNNGIVEREEVTEDDARGWIDNPGYSSEGYRFVIDTSDKVERKFKKMVREHLKLLKRDLKNIEDRILGVEKVLENFSS